MHVNPVRDSISVEIGCHPPYSVPLGTQYLSKAYRTLRHDFFRRHPFSTDMMFLKEHFSTNIMFLTEQFTKRFIPKAFSVFSRGVLHTPVFSSQFHFFRSELKIAFRREAKRGTWQLFLPKISPQKYNTCKKTLCQIVKTLCQIV